MRIEVGCQSGKKAEQNFAGENITVKTQSQCADDRMAGVQLVRRYNPGIHLHDVNNGLHVSQSKS